jgi:hypothetical protein
MIIAFVAQTLIALAKNTPISFGLWDWIAAMQTAAWRLKWVAIPVTALVLWGGRKLYQSILRSPEDYCGMRYARAGFIAACAVPLMIAALIGVTVPERLRQRAWASEAAWYARGYTFERAFMEYRELNGKLPDDLEDLRELPDPDGSIAAALASLDPKTYSAIYKPSADVAAALPKRKGRTTVIKASLSTPTEDALAEGLSFTNYELKLPGADKLPGTEDDLVVRDGQITRATDSVKPIVTTATSAKP